jgi:hypothetical protein
VGHALGQLPAHALGATRTTCETRTTCGCHAELVPLLKRDLLAVALHTPTMPPPPPEL